MQGSVTSPNINFCCDGCIFFLDLFRQEELNYDKQKCREMLLEAAETVLGYFGFDRLFMMQNLLERLIESGGMNLQKNGLET
jgi:hypothetical protein